MGATDLIDNIFGDDERHLSRLRRLWRHIDRGVCQRLEGRSPNEAYVVNLGGRCVTVKVHSPGQSGRGRLEAIGLVDRALRGASWYPAVEAAGYLSLAGQRRLVVARPYVAGQDCEPSPAVLPQLTRIMGEMHARTSTVEASAEELVVFDYASCWLGLDRRVLEDESFSRLSPANRPDLDRLISSALRLTTPKVTIHHGDLHVRNLLRRDSGGVSLRDWDDTGLSNRPSDAAKAIWLLCRVDRGDFIINPASVRLYFNLLDTHLNLGKSEGVDLAQLGALWFLPSDKHIDALNLRDPRFGEWYVDWITKFWSSFCTNMQCIEAVAAEK